MENETENALEYAMFEAEERAADIEAIAWAYGKCVALGLESNTMENAMRMDRLKSIIGGYGGG